MSLFTKIKALFVRPQNYKDCEDIQKSGTGFMPSVSEMITELEKKGFKENLVAHKDHFEFDNGKKKLYPKDFVVEKLYRFENTSDPNDQAAVYAIQGHDGNKGIYVEAYGLYQDTLSEDMIQKLKEHLE